MATDNDEPVDDARLRDVVTRFHAHVWRVVRNLGVHSADLDDAVQQVFIVAAKKLGDIEHGSERAFLYGTAVRIASRARRAQKRRRETVDAGAADAISAGETPADALDHAEKRALLDAALAALDDDQRTVFVMYEIEQLTLAEIAELLEMPMGTVSTRLRRARERFLAHARRIEAKRAFEGGAR